MISLTASNRAPALLWLTAALIAVLAPLSPLAHAVLGTAAAIAALLLPQPSRTRILTALAMIPVGIATAPAWSLVLAGGVLAAVLARPAPASVPSSLERIQRQLEWCRRRDEVAHLLWVHAPGTGSVTARSALDAFRVTDAAALLHEGDGHEEIVAMVDDASFEREGLERRLRAQLGDGAGFGWASFPADGVTLDTLFQQARMAAVASAKPQPIGPSAQLQPRFRRLGSRPPTGVPARSSNQG